MTSPLFRFSLLSLALAAGFAHAENEAKESVTLDTVTVKGDRQGSKIRTNIVTLQQKDENTATDLRGLLKDEPAIDFGGGNGSSQFLTLRGMGQNSVDIKVDNAYSDSQMLYHQGRFIIDPALVKNRLCTERRGFCICRYRRDQRRDYYQNRRCRRLAQRFGQKLGGTPQQRLCL